MQRAGRERKRIIRGKAVNERYVPRKAAEKTAEMKGKTRKYASN